MDPIAFLGAYSIWLFTFIAGGATMLGLAQITTGRMVFGLGYGDWSVREARQFGAICVVCGLVQGLYLLYGGLTLEAKLFPLVGIGHWWGILIPYIPNLVLIVGASSLGAMIGNHRKGRASRARRG